MSVRVEEGDSREVLKALADDSVHACVTDPPYSLQTINKRFAKVGRDDKTWSRSGPHQRTAAGFMNQKWDTGETAHDPAFWAEVLRVLKPGAHLVAFGGSRTYHRMVCAIEDAGFEVRDQLAWVYASGFPKSHNISKAIDKAERGVPHGGADPTSPNHGKYKTQATEGKRAGGDSGQGYGAGPGQFMAEKGETDHRELSGDAADWAGWGTALKPSFEPVCVAQKPYTSGQQFAIIGSTIQNLERQLWSLLPASAAAEIFKLSQSALNEVCASAPWSAAARSNTRDALCAQMDTSQFVLATASSLSTASLWKECWAESLAHGSTSTTETASRTIIDPGTWKSCLSKITVESIILAHRSGRWSNADASPAERYLTAAALKWHATRELSAAESALGAAPISYQGEIGPIKPDWSSAVLARKPLSEPTVAANVLKHGTGAINIDGCKIESETTTGWGGKAAGGNTWNAANSGLAKDGAARPAEGRWPANLAHDGSQEILAAFPGAPGQQRPAGPQHGAKVSVNCYGDYGERQHHAPAGDSGSAARFFFSAKAGAEDRWGSRHPTVKPVSLMRWLARLVTPPGGLVLDPFAGSGTTGVACIAEGFDCILIEREAPYVADIRERLAHYSGEGRHSTVSKTRNRKQVPLGGLFSA